MRCVLTCAGSAPRPDAVAARRPGGQGANSRGGEPGQQAGASAALGSGRAFSPQIGAPSGAAIRVSQSVSNLPPRQSRAPPTASRRCFPATLAGSLPKPDWLAGAERPLAALARRRRHARTGQRRRDAALAQIQEDAGLEVVGDGEQSRQHFVHGSSNGSGHRLRAQGEDGHPQQPLRRDGAPSHSKAAPGRPGARRRGAAGAGAHRA